MLHVRANLFERTIADERARNLDRAKVPVRANSRESRV